MRRLSGDFLGRGPELQPRRKCDEESAAVRTAARTITESVTTSGKWTEVVKKGTKVATTFL